MSDRANRIVAMHLRNHANTLLHIGGCSGSLIADILATATAIDGQQPDNRFSNIPGRLADKPKIDIHPDELNSRIEALERVNEELREATRKMHRRAQAAERTHMMVVDYLTNWYNLLGIHRHSKRDRLLFRWAIRELKSRSDRMSLMDAKEREE